MKKCLVCNTENPDYATFCSKCLHSLPYIQETTYALREFLSNNQKLFMVMGIFLAIALFFNSAELFTISPTQSNSPTSYQTICERQSLGLNCINNSSSTKLNCFGVLTEFNCTSNLSTENNRNSNNQNYFKGLLEIFSLLCLIPFVVISLVILIDSFKYFGRLAKHATKLNVLEGLYDTLKDATITIFIIPFIFIIFYFSILLIFGFIDYLSIAGAILRAVVFVIYIMVFLFLLGRILYQIKNEELNPKPAIALLIILGIIIIGMGLFLFHDYLNEMLIVGLLSIFGGIFALLMEYPKKKDSK
jgi:hypothetical protein